MLATLYCNRTTCAAIEPESFGKLRHAKTVIGPKWSSANRTEKANQYRVTAFPGNKMKFFRLIRPVPNDKNGAMAVDWVVLAAVVIGLGVAAMSVLRTGVEDLSAGIKAHLPTDRYQEATPH